MTKTFEVLIEVETALKKLKDTDAGHLIGFETGNTVSIIGLIVSSSQDASQEELESMLPHPLAVVGSAVGAAATSPTQGLVAKLATGGGALTYSYTGSSVSPSIVSSNPLYSRCAMVRCAIDSTLEAPAGGDVGAAVYALEAQLRGPRTLFSIRSSSNNAPVSLVGSQLIEICGGSLEAPVVMDALMDAGFGSREGSLSAPLADVQPAKGKIRWSTLHLDVLCFVPKGTSAVDAAKKYLVPALSRQLRSLRTLVGGTRRPFRAVHFSPPNMYHPITVLYPLPTPATEADETTLHTTRRAIHASLGLPLDRPLLRLANAIDPGNLRGTATTNKSETGQDNSLSNAAGGSSSATRRLKNVHEGLPPSGIRGGTTRLVLGEYDYYHYMQDKFDDSGWGCAYRSLQTICSWFRRQHYTARVPPGHREIQTELVKLGDKGQEFIGSRQWIGAIELGYVLDAVLGVECKVMTVQSGADMPSKAREIAQHFETQGTPIMIGGGVLAYTLLGIDYNENTGEAAFLILDPHYTGVDDLGRIHSGQWVAWKRLGDKAAAGGELFVANAFYNLLCPQRPRTV